jgi:acyl-CoA reductase-like NAD-dependent aldehyde dehydrogenase
MSPSATSNGTSNGVADKSHSALDWHTFRNVIDGELTTTEKTRTGINPANSEPNDPVPVSTPEDVDRAIAAAEKAFRGWADTPYEERRKAINKFADAIEAEKDNFAKLLVKEQGKPVRSSPHFPPANLSPLD